VEHIDPTDILGWVVLATRQHRHALHDLSRAEWDEMFVVLPALCRAMQELIGCDKEYLAQFAEQEGFQHVHVHVVPRMSQWPPETAKPITEEEMTTFSLRLRHRLNEVLAQ
jgi:diadenosine tetraphosphate (Ap4A) HIT family hydrolase